MCLPRFPRSPRPTLRSQVRRPFERLIRKLLLYPRRPAVILIHAYRWFQLPPENSGQVRSGRAANESVCGRSRGMWGLPA